MFCQGKRSSVKTTHTKRLVCPRCQRAQLGCICQWIHPTPSATEILILQHPMEVNEAKGSARLLSLSLLNSRIEVGEWFDPMQLQALLTAPWSANTSMQGQKQAILLYPELPQNAANLAQTVEQLLEPAQLRLVVIDGSWRKSRKMLYLNPLLQNLPRLRLNTIPASKYLIRKAHRADQLSTFEATCAALMQLEGNVAKFAALLDSFDGFVQQHIQAKSSAMTTTSRHH